MRMMHTPVSSSCVGEDRVLDWSRTPPAGQKRGVHVQAMIRRALENIDRQDHAVSRNDDEVGPILLERGDSLGVFEGRRLLDRNTEAHRGFLHGRCDELLPRPRTTSGRVYAATTL